MHKNPAEKSSHITPREIAYLALLAAKREERYIADTLDEWIRQTDPSPRDAALAREIAYGSCRMALALDAIGAQCASSGKLSLKSKERLLLHTALYQHFYLKRIPLYAIVNETLEVARKYCHAQFVKFLNGALRSLETFKPSLPAGDSIADISIRLSYPAHLVEELISAYGTDQAKAILEAGNLAAPTMFRVRAPAALASLPEEAYRYVEGSGDKTALLLNSGSMPAVAASPMLYIQNATPAALMAFLKEGGREPKSILDVCASPGGKLLLAHDLFPGATLHGNDVSLQKVERLNENLAKYGIAATVTCGKGEELQSDSLFDLIILDVPCSNTGVLNKRPEARWRFNREHIAETARIQMELLTHAVGLLADNGEIWYLTCSIMPAENEILAAKAQEKLGLQVRAMKTILPNTEGWDGGFACALQKSGT